MTLARPEYLWLLLAVPVTGFFMVMGAVRRRRLLAAYPHLVRSSGRRFKGACFLSGLALCTLAAAGPGFGVETVVLPPPPPLRLIVALDCSRSMLARDLAPDRLTAAKGLVLDVLSRLPDVEAGLVAFAGRAWLACPVTADRTALALFLDAASPKDAPLGGTSPATALEAARLALAGYARGAVLLVSDGEVTVAETDVSRSGDAPLFTVAVGGATPAPVPDGSGGFLRLASGQPVLSGVDAAALADLAKKGGGTAFRLAPDASNPAPDIAAALAALMPQPNAPTPTTRSTDRSEIVLATGLGLLLLDLLVAPTGRVAALLLLAIFVGFSQPARAASSAADNVTQGLAAWEKGTPEEALTRFLAARARAPEDPTILFDIGATYYRLGRFDKAHEAFDRAARGAAGTLRAKALYNQGNAAYRLGDADAAMKLYEAALAIDPNDVDAQANLEWLLSRKKAQTPPEEQKGETGEVRHPGQNPSGTEEGKAQQEGQAPSPQGNDDGSGGERHGEETATAAPSPDPTQNSGQATTPVAAAEGQKAGEKKAQTSGAATDAVLSRIPDLPGSPVPPAYGRPSVEKDW